MGDDGKKNMGHYYGIVHFNLQQRSGIVFLKLRYQKFLITDMLTSEKQSHKQQLALAKR